MEMLKKPETLITAVIVIILIGYIAYDYRKHNAQAEKIKTIEEHLSATVRAVDAITQQTGKIGPLGQELINLKTRQEKLEEEEEKVEELEDKCKELVDALDEILDHLKEQGMTINIDFPEFGHEIKKSRGKKKSKGKKEVKKSKKSKGKKKSRVEEEQSSNEEGSSSEDDEKSKAIARISRLRDKKKDKK